MFAKCYLKIGNVLKNGEKHGSQIIRVVLKPFLWDLFCNFARFLYLYTEHPDIIMETTRQQRIERLLQKELSEIFQRQTQLMHGVLVSVSKVRISPDLSICKVYLSIFPSERGEELLKNIRIHVRELRYNLGERVRHQLRIIPELKFFIDDSLDYIDHIDELLKK